MASFYNRPSYSWTPRRIYPRVEPTFDEPTPPSPAPPPPLYFPSRSSDPQQPLPTGHVRSPSIPHSIIHTIRWRSHPAVRHGWRRIVLRPEGWWRCLVRQEGEVLESGWPAEFGGRGRVSEERGEGDSGIGIIRRTTREGGEAHSLEEVYESRICTVNEIITGHLRSTRTILALLELLDVVWLTVLVVAIGVTRGKQEPFLQAVELTLIVLIIANGAGANMTRVKRWALAKRLRHLARDWSPLPITSSTNQGLVNNFLGPAPDADRLAEAQAAKETPALRWSMRQTEGSWWLSYRPIIKVELVTPSSTVAPPLEAQQSLERGHSLRRVPVPTIDVEVEPEGHAVPVYSERAG